MKLSKDAADYMAAYSSILGIFYIIIGIIEFMTGLWNLFTQAAIGFLGIPVDLYGGFACLVIGASYSAATSLWKGRYESLGFILVATLLSGVFGVLYLIIVGADGLEALLAFWKGEEWTWEWLTVGTAGSGLLRPEIWLFFSSLPLGYSALKAAKAKEG